MKQFFSIFIHLSLCLFWTKAVSENMLLIVSLALHDKFCFFYKPKYNCLFLYRSPLKMLDLLFLVGFELLCCLWFLIHTSMDGQNICFLVMLKETTLLSVLEYCLKWFFFLIFITKHRSTTFLSFNKYKAFPAITTVQFFANVPPLTGTNI